MNVAERWQVLAQDAYEASQLLMESGRLRSSVSRAYYAVYAGLTSYFSANQRIDFAYGGNNPSHEQMLSLVFHNLDAQRFTIATRQVLRREVTAMQRRRIVADYVPSQSVDRRDARDQVRSAAYVLRTLEAAA